MTKIFTLLEILGLPLIPREKGGKEAGEE